MDRQRLTIYLAGLISGCNETQKSPWRRDIKKLLGRETNMGMSPHAWFNAAKIIGRLFWKETGFGEHATTT